MGRYSARTKPLALVSEPSSQAVSRVAVDVVRMAGRFAAVDSLAVDILGQGIRVDGRRARPRRAYRFLVTGWNRSPIDLRRPPARARAAVVVSRRGRAQLSSGSNTASARARRRRTLILRRGKQRLELGNGGGQPEESGLPRAVNERDEIADGRVARYRSGLLRVLWWLEGSAPLEDAGERDVAGSALREPVEELLGVAARLPDVEE